MKSFTLANRMICIVASQRPCLFYPAFFLLVLPMNAWAQTIDHNTVLQEATKHYAGDIPAHVRANPIVTADAMAEPTFTLSKGDVIKSVITSDASGHHMLTITFTPERRIEFNAFTEGNLNKQVKFVCEGKVVCQPRLLGIIKGPSMEIPVATAADAASIVDSTLSTLSPHELELKQQELETQSTDLERASHDPSQNKLVENLQAALDARDKAAFEKCFNFDGTNDELRKSFRQIEDEIFALPSYYVFIQNRIDQGKAQMTKDGKNYTLNGDWTFDVGIYISKTPSKGFVLPAGTANGKCQMLLTVEEKPTP